MKKPLACAAVVLGLLAIPQSPAQAGGCANANAMPGEASAKQLGRSVLCLVNRERKKADKKPVKADRDLTDVARRHTDVMIKKDCLNHQCKGEKKLKKRIEDSGYLSPGDRYGYGEILGCSLTPQAMFNAWMKRDFERKIIRGGKFRQVGVGARKGKVGVAGCDDGGRRGVYALLFAWKR